MESNHPFEVTSLFSFSVKFLSGHVQALMFLYQIVNSSCNMQGLIFTVLAFKMVAMNFAEYEFW